MRLVRIAGGVIAVVLLFAFAAGPQFVAGRLNRVVHPGPYTISARTQALLNRIEVVDLHGDSLLWGRNLAVRSSTGQIDVPRLIEGRVAIQAFTIVTKSPRSLNVNRNEASAPDNITSLMLLQLAPTSTWSSLRDRALLQARRFDRTVAISSGKLMPIRTRADLDSYLELRSANRNVTAGFLGVEGAHALDGDLANIDVLFDAGVRMMSPTHFFDNDIGGSSAGVNKGGLTDKGRQMVRRMEQRGMLVDIAHASEAVIDDVLAVATKPVISSHTGVKATCESPRNLSDRHLKAIAATGGVVGIAYFNFAVCSENVADIVKAMRHAVNVVGIEHVAFGSDFDGAVTTPFDTTGIGVLIDEMLKAGFTEDEVAKIAGGNAIRVLRQTLPAN